MPLLREGRAVSDRPRTRLPEDQPLPSEGTRTITVPLSRFLQMGETERARIDGVAIAPTDEVQRLSPDVLERLTLVEIDFAAYTDGRGYSHARTLRRLGYHGEIRATGDVRLDQLLFMRRVGIDGAHIEHPIDAGLLERTLHRFTHTYQTGYPISGASDTGSA